MPLLKEDAPASYPLTVAKDKFSALTARANETDCPFVVLKGGKPWVEVRPLAAARPNAPADIVIEPVRRKVVIADIDRLFIEYDSSSATRAKADPIWGDYPEQLISPARDERGFAGDGRYVPGEDGFAAPVGGEEL